MAFRQHLLLIMQDRGLPLSQRLCLLCEAVDCPTPVMSAKKAADFLQRLEQLDPAWAKRLEQLRYLQLEQTDAFSLQGEQLACYLLFRHLPGALEDERLRERVMFAAWSVLFLAALSQNATDYVDAARAFSAEIEYSEENMDAMLTWLGEMCDGTDGLL